MAEARSEEEDDNMTRDTREQQVARRQPGSSGGRPNRRKPEHRISQGPLSSIRAAIKRTSARPTPQSESSRERDRDRDRDRRRPEITILSAEPLTPTSWFPGSSGGFPPPPPPAAQIWGPTIPPSIQPPPSYEEVIRQKTQEQGVLPSCSSSSPSSSSSSHSPSTITIATQTDSGSAPVSEAVKRPLRPTRPTLPCPFKPSSAPNASPNESPHTSQDRDIVLNALPEGTRFAPAHAQRCDLPAGLCSALPSDAAAQTEQTFAAAAPPSQVLQERPRPRPRSRISAPPTCSEVKVQTLVKLRDDGLATLAARAAASPAEQGVSQGSYLQELLEAFSADDWGFPEHRSDGSECSQSESEEYDEKEDKQDMATLRARIQAFEQQPVSDGSCESSNSEDFDNTKRPEPRPRPRLQPLPTKSPPPTIAPKPKNFSNAPKPSTKLFWEASDSTPVVATHTCSSDSVETAGNLQANNEHAHTFTAASSDSTPQPCKETEKPPLSVKPSAEALISGTSVPVPAPRPGSSKAEPQPRLPPRPAVAPRASMGPVNQEKEAPPSSVTPTLPPRPSSVKGSVRPDLPAKPAALSSPRRASAPNLGAKQTGASSSPSDLTPLKPPGAAHSLKHAAPVPAQRKGAVIQPQPENTNTDPPLPPRPSYPKQLPLRPPPMKSTPGRPPPPAIVAMDSTCSSQQMNPPPPKAAPITSSTCKPLSSHSTSAVSDSHTSQRAPKKGPPLPPRPKPGHPLFNSSTKQEVLIVLDDAKPPEDPSPDEKSQTAVTPITSPPPCLLDLDIQPNHGPEGDSQSKPAFMDHSLPDAQSILPLQPPEQKEQPDLSPPSGPRCVALFDYEGEEEDELTFSQGDNISLLELIGQEWARGEIHGRVGIFPLNFVEVVEPLPLSGSSSAETPNKTAEPSTPRNPPPEAQEWAVALYDFPGQTAEDLSFHKGAIIQVLGHVDAEWRRGRLEGREGLYPAAFTQPCAGKPITDEHSAVKGVAKFDFTAENEDELTLKAGDEITQVECVDEQWIVGSAGGKRGIVPRSFISLP